MGKIAEIHLVDAAPGLSAAVLSRCCDKPLVSDHTQTLAHMV